MWHGSRSDVESLIVCHSACGMGHGRVLTSQLEVVGPVRQECAFSSAHCTFCPGASVHALCAGRRQGRGLVDSHLFGVRSARGKQKKLMPRSGARPRQPCPETA
eukprot:14508789-Alexandrium_andersonii.AAC.1